MQPHVHEVRYDCLFKAPDRFIYLFFFTTFIRLTTEVFEYFQLSSRNKLSLTKTKFFQLTFSISPFSFFYEIGEINVCEILRFVIVTW